jgi:RNA recognition motif-containing protein
MNIYVGNLSYELTEEELRGEFEAFGEVSSVNIIMDRYSGRPRGFGFVEMPNVSEGQEAIKQLNGKMVKDRALKVNPAKPPSEGRGQYGKQRW